MNGNEKDKNVLEIKNLNVVFRSGEKRIHAVNNLEFNARAGATLGIVGESGSGKSVTSLAIMGLLRGTTGRVTSGSIIFDGRDLIPLKEKERRDIRGKEISMIFQEAKNSLNPTARVGKQIGEIIRLHRKLSRAETKVEVLNLLRASGFEKPDYIYAAYPFQLSGGQCQRVMIAIGMACRPRLLIADEPTTALDVTIQAQILDLINKMKKEFGTSILFITHNLGVVAEVCDDVLVMYGGRAVEKGSWEDVFRHPEHPYTRGLFASVPRMDIKTDKLYTIPGNVPDPSVISAGCDFAPRCPEAIEICIKQKPPICFIENDHCCYCWKSVMRNGGTTNE